MNIQEPEVKPVKVHSKTEAVKVLLDQLGRARTKNRLNKVVIRLRKYGVDA